MKKDPGMKKARRKRGIYLLPNLFTTTNLFFGFYSILATTRENFYTAALVIILAMILDSLDGRIARMTNSISKFGAEYDSLADLVTFGVAPAVLAYVWSLSPFGRWGWMAAFLFVVCGALRLARYNIQIGIIESRIFNGLPIPAASSLIATSVMLYHYLGGTGKMPHITVLIGIIVLALLMVSNFKYYSFKELNFFSRKPFMSFVLIVFVIVTVYAETEIALFILSFCYALSGPVWWLQRHYRKSDREETEASFVT